MKLINPTVEDNVNNIEIAMNDGPTASVRVVSLKNKK